MDNASNFREDTGMGSMMKVLLIIAGLHVVAISGLYYLAMNLIVG